MATDYTERCGCGHTRSEHHFDGNEDSIVCDFWNTGCDCSGFEAPDFRVTQHGPFAMVAPLNAPAERWLRNLDFPRAGDAVIVPNESLAALLAGIDEAQMLVEVRR